MTKTSILAFVLAVCYVLFGKLSSYFGEVSSIINIDIFIPEGIALAFALLFGRKVVWGIFLGQFVFAILNHLGFFPALLIGISNTIEALLAIYFAQQWKIDLHLRDLKSVLRFFGLVVLILQPFSAIVGNIILLLFGASEIEKFFVYTLSWWLGNVMAQLIITPMLLLSYFAYLQRQFDIKKLFLTIVSLFLLLHFVVMFLHIDNMALLMSITLPLLFLVSYYFGTLYGSIAITVISYVMLLFTKYGIGAFTTQSEFDNIVNLNFYMLAHVVIFYIHQAIYHEKEQLVEELHYANENLQQRVTEEIAKNREKEKYLLYQSRLAQMGETINMIAHQWRQPLNTLSIMIQTLMLQYKKGSLTQEKMKKFYHDMQEQIDGMSQTIDSFRDFFKPEKEKTLFDIKDVLDFVLTITQKELQRNHISLECTHPVSVKIEGYPNELGQALVNIINNAKDQLQHSTQEEKWIKISCKELQDSIVIEIEDDAGGIPSELLEKIFEPYFSTKEEKNGTGLGLYITKLIIEDHMGGTIRASNEKEGALFSIELRKTTESQG